MDIEMTLDVTDFPARVIASFILIGYLVVPPNFPPPETHHAIAELSFQASIGSGAKPSFPV
jgi:hypothetical protein